MMENNQDKDNNEQNSNITSQIKKVTTPLGIKIVNKKQSYLVALIAASIIAFSSVSVSFTRDTNKQTQISVSTREVSVTTLVPCLLLIASALGFDTDKLALLIGKIFNINGRQE